MKADEFRHATEESATAMRENYDVMLDSEDGWIPVDGIRIDQSAGIIVIEAETEAVFEKARAEGYASAVKEIGEGAGNDLKELLDAVLERKRKCPFCRKSVKDHREGCVVPRAQGTVKLLKA